MGFSPLAIRRQLIEEGVAERFSQEIRGFTKVGGNEWNALLVYAALLEISIKTPAMIKLSDEGEFLLSDVLIKNGKVRPDRGSIEAQLAYWEKQGSLETNKHGSADKAKLFRKLLKHKNRWLQPERLCRQVKPEDFSGHPEYNAGEIMAGFRGEYWGLNGDFNPFDASMQAIARIKEQLPEGVELRFGEPLD